MPTLNLFIDTNVLLNFFHLSGEDIEELRKLLQLIEHKKLKLWVPSQVCDEFKRNREVKISDAMKSVTTALKLTVPAFYKNAKDYGDIAADLKKLNKRYAALRDEVDQKVASRALDADTLIADLFKKAVIVDVEEDDIFDAAVDRARRGNPPGKKERGVIGDELNWEALLSAIPEGEELHVVSVDGDYASVLDGGILSRFLEEEWKERKKADARLYRGISAFLGVHFKDIKLASDVAKSAAIDRLGESGSFARTHSAIAELVQFMGNFTADDVDLLVEIGEENQQVNWIISDDDVASFYSSLRDTVAIPEDLAKRLNALVPEADVTPQVDDIPF